MHYFDLMFSAQYSWQVSEPWKRGLSKMSGQYGCFLHQCKATTGVLRKRQYVGRTCTPQGSVSNDAGPVSPIIRTAVTCKIEVSYFLFDLMFSELWTIQLYSKRNYMDNSFQFTSVHSMLWFWHGINDNAPQHLLIYFMSRNTKLICNLQIRSNFFKTYW